MGTKLCSELCDEPNKIKDPRSYGRRHFDSRFTVSPGCSRRKGRWLVTSNRRSSFTKEIWATSLPGEFKLSNIKAYDGKVDSQDHIDYLNDLMELHQVSDLAKDKVFTMMLNNRAKNGSSCWNQIPITNWLQLSTKFLRQFQATKQFSVPLGTWEMWNSENERHSSLTLIGLV